ncbi:MAG: ABC transporter ATP-binding protein [Eubacteriales bacterium]|nr:ABC transporter ATP-binding protein [Eubacteriales bacterium]
MESSKSLLCQLEAISFSYQGRQEQVLRDINMEIHRGEMILLAGPSGGGKSTLLQVLNGIIPAHVKGNLSGALTWYPKQGEEFTITALKPAARAALIGTVMQNADDQILYDKTEDEIAFVLENLAVLPAEMPGRIDAALEKVDLQRGLQTMTLSGGQKQRLVTAVTLAMGQELVILDEPLANLDVAGAIGLLKTLKQLTAEGRSVVLIEHRMDLLPGFIDRRFWLADGQLRELSQQQLEQLQNMVMTTRTPRGSASGGEVCLELEAAAFAVRQRQILEPLDFCLRSGERWLVVGDNGGGKSTFLSLLAGGLKPTKGRYRSRYPKRQHFGRVGMILQNPSYQLCMPTVWEEVNLNSRNSELAERLLAHFELEELTQRHPHSLSEGQKRRLGIAAVLAGEPEVLLLDEPTVGLDPKSLDRLLSALEIFCDRQKLAMVTITHDERCAAWMGDRVLWISRGRHRSGGMELFREYKEEGKSIC